MALDCVIGEILKPIKTFVYDTIKDYVSHIRSYDQNIDVLVEKLEDLRCKKQDINTKVLSGKDKLERITKEAARWLKSVRQLSQKEELKKLYLSEHKIAEVAVKLMEEKDLKKVLKKDSEVQGVVAKVVKEHNGDDYEKVARAVVEVIKDTTEDFKRLMKEDTKVAVVAVTLLKDEELEKLSEADAEMAEIIKRARAMCEEKLWESSVSDDEELEDVKNNSVNENTIREAVGKLLRPLQKLTENEDFMKVLPENVRLGAEIMDGLSKGSGLKDEITKNHRGGCYCMAVPFLYFQHRYERSIAAEQLAKDIQSIIDKLPQDPVTLPVRAGDLKPIPSEFVRDLESREMFLQTILEKLQDDQVNAVGIFGMGGAGKTVLAKEVVNSKAKINFDPILMVEISESPNIERIQDQIAEALGLPLNDVHSLPQRAIKLYNRLKQGKEGKGSKETKTLIVLDNMWQTLNLGEIGIPCESTNDFCCKFLVTSREENVCQLMGVKKSCIFQLRVLSELESKELFHYHADAGKKICEGEYKSIIERLLNKCGGLPLTIVATANALKGKDLSMWRHFANELEKPVSSQVSGVHHQTYSILETSYNVMESEEKKMFFLLVCLSPLGSSISIENLMRYAIGLGLIQHVNILSEAMQQASTWATELISQSMLLEGDSDGHVRIHDVVRASAISFAAKGKHMFLVEAIPRWMFKETFNKYTAISLLSGHSFSCLNGVKAEMLQILLLKGDLSHSSKLDDCFFQGMTHLKVLHLSYMNMEPELPESIMELKNLKTLHLEHCKLGDISVICELIELLVLSLRDSVLEELPVDMGNLGNLRMLDMSGCKVNLNRTPADKNVIASLSSLEGLYLFDNFKEWAIKTISGSITESKHLNSLEMHVQRLQHLPIADSCKNLDMFNICLSDSQKGLKGKIKPLCRALEINKLHLDKALKLSSCLEVLMKRADCLRLYANRVKNNLVPELDIEGFKDLKYLDIELCLGMECVINTDDLNDFIAFQNLEHLRLRSVNTLQMLCKGEAPPGMFSNLRHLELQLLDGLQYALPLALLPRNLTRIDIYNCKSLKVIFDENKFVSSDGEFQEHKEMDTIKLSSLKSLEIIEVRVLVNMFGQAKMSTMLDQAFFNRKIMCPSLELLRLSYFRKITNLWSKELDIHSFPKLKVIDISSCNELQSLGSPAVFSALLQLESLSVGWSEKMQEVITTETEEPEISEKTIKFPQLKNISLKSLSNLESFYLGSYKLEFPKLKKLELCYLSNLTTFVSKDPTALFNEKVKFPSLEELEVINVKATQLWNGHSLGEEDAPKLIKLTIDSIESLREMPYIVSRNISSLQLHSNGNLCSTMKVLFSTSGSSENEELVCIDSSHLPKLENLRVKNFQSLETLFEYEENAAAATSTFIIQLRHLELDGLQKLNLIPLHLFKNLRSLHISHLKWKYVFPSVGVVRELEMLEDVNIEHCYEMEVVIQAEEEASGNDRVVMFRRLRTLKLHVLDAHSFCSKQDITMHLPSLEKLIIDCLKRLQVFCAGSIVAPKLKEVILLHCWEMKCFLYGNSSQAVELLSLQRVKISGGHIMHSFSNTPLIAPNLREVLIVDCADMHWFLPGYPSHNVLELPSLEMLCIGRQGLLQYKETKLRSFSPGLLIAPKLTQVRAYGKDYSIQEICDLNNFLKEQLYKDNHEARSV